LETIPGKGSNDMNVFVNHPKLGPCAIKKPTTPLVCMGQTTRRFGPHISKIEQFWDHSSRFLWRCSGFSCELFVTKNHNTQTEAEYIFLGNGDDKPIRFWFPGTILIMLHPVHSHLYVLGDNGGSLAMTNVWTDGRFCIGAAVIERFDFSVPDIIIYGKPNKDLGWHIPGKSVIATPSDPCPIITSWPQTTTKTTLPWPRAADTVR
jgi:hypothetical protein